MERVCVVSVARNKARPYKHTEKRVVVGWGKREREREEEEEEEEEETGAAERLAGVVCLSTINNGRADKTAR